MKISTFIFSIFLSFSTLAIADDHKSSLSAVSAWTNQSGSTLYINTIDANGLLSGTYINREAGYGCQNIAYPVTGWVYGTAITFTTTWESQSESCNSITAWTGFYAQGQITTLWQLVINGSTSPSQILKGSDVFTSSTKVENKSLILE